MDDRRVDSRSCATAGVDLIEIGFPYSDPIADGPVIQASYTRALANKVRLPEIFGGLKALTGESHPPLLAMVAYAIVFRAGSRAVRAVGGRRRIFRTDRARSPGRSGGRPVRNWLARWGSISFRSSLRRRRPSESTASCNRRAGLCTACRSPARREFAKRCPRNSPEPGRTEKEDQAAPGRRLRDRSAGTGRIAPRPGRRRHRRIGALSGRSSDSTAQSPPIARRCSTKSARFARTMAEAAHNGVQAVNNSARSRARSPCTSSAPARSRSTGRARRPGCSRR